MVSQHMKLCRNLLVISPCFAFFFFKTCLVSLSQVSTVCSIAPLKGSTKDASLQASSVKSRLYRFRKSTFSDLVCQPYVRS
ncbi:hypothetical protein V8C35DRAFT_24026 [Trichoderma chlorosporum]